MRQILLAAFVLAVPSPAFAQKDQVVEGEVNQKNRDKLLSKPNRRFPHVAVIAQDADLRDERYVVGSITRGHGLRVERTEADRYQVWWQGKGVWINRADVLPTDEALDYFTEAIRQNPNAVDYVARGGLRLGTDLEGALDDFNKAIALDQSQAWFYDDRGSGWIAKGELDKAMADFNTAILIDPNYAPAHKNRGLVHLITGAFVKAIADCDTAIRLDPTDSHAYGLRGWARESQGDIEQAVIDFSSAISLDPKDVNAYSHRGLAFRGKGDFDRAISDYDEAIRLDPTNPKILNARGDARWMKKDYDGAIADFSESIRLDPKYAFAFNNRGNAWRAKRDCDQALADFDEAIRLDPTYAMAHNNRGLALRDLGEFEKALAAFDEAIRLDPKYVDAYCHRARIRASCPDERLRDGRKAVEDAKTACELRFWKDFRSIGFLAAAYAELGEFDKAIESQQRALEVVPKAGRAMFQVRLELYQAGKPYRDEPVKR